jgi:penicillin amidase
MILHTHLNGLYIFEEPMRIFPFILSAVVTIGLIVVLSIPFGSTPAVGALLSPSHGFWKNAEPSVPSFTLNIQSDQLQDSVSVYLDDRLVPHVFAQNDHDLYFVQGWLHAKFRLWQMEFQTYAAAGRLCEVLGEKLGNSSVLDGHDRKFRRLGMGFAAEKALKATEEDKESSDALHAYTAGINTYINHLHKADYPIEYKLLGYSPEPWTDLKTMLVFKYMSHQLTTDFDDFEATVLRNAMGKENFDKLYPLMVDSSKPIVPKMADFVPTGALPVMPANAAVTDFDDIAAIAIMNDRPDPDNGSNNWAVSGTRTASGSPILCNDPHLGLNLPSLWYEIQLHTPMQNVYGVSLPGVPTVIIGFNDSIAWGMTNASRDVMDFYEVRFKDSTMEEYWYDSAWKKTAWRNETIRIKGKADFTEKVPMTVWGPVMYDANYPITKNNQKAYAVRWTAHDPSIELKASMDLNNAENYEDFLKAITPHNNPGQNFVFASKRNEIAIWQTGRFPAKWRQQGDFVMPGWDSSFAWQGFVSFEDQVHQYNPAWGIVSSANQIATDTSYPFYLGGTYDVCRGIIIKRALRTLDSSITVTDMQQLQTDVYNVFAELARPLLVNNIQQDKLTSDAQSLLNQFAAWNMRAEPNDAGMTIFDAWWNNFCDTVWSDEWNKYGTRLGYPDGEVLIDGITKDSAYPFIDNIETSQVETLPEMVTAALNKTAAMLTAKPGNWAAVKDTRVTHLLRIPAFSREHLNIGGGLNMINCTKSTHGPSWRMVVQLSGETDAWGVYPGGQSGNPGSIYYDQFVDQWTKGKYYRLWMMQSSEATSGNVKWTMTFKKA